jgi:hypothetical protein
MHTIVSALIATALAMPVPVGAQSGLSLCEQFRQRLSVHGTPELQPLEEVDLGDGNLEIRGLIPPDNSSLTLVLSSSRQSFTVEFPRFYVFKYGDGVYVIGTKLLSEQGPLQREIHRLDGKGIAPVCSYTCGLTTGCSRRETHAAESGR